MGMKSRGCFSVGKQDDTDPGCFTIAQSCANYGFKCVECIKIQGVWTEYKKKGEPK